MFLGCGIPKSSWWVKFIPLSRLGLFLMICANLIHWKGLKCLTYFTVIAMPRCQSSIKVKVFIYSINKENSISMLVVALRYQTLAIVIKPLKSHVGTARESAVCSYWIFTSDSSERLAELICQHMPEQFNHVYLVSGGSEAVESALKMARQYFVESGKPEKSNSSRVSKVITAIRWELWRSVVMNGDVNRSNLSCIRVITLPRAMLIVISRVMSRIGLLIASGE